MPWGPGGMDWIFSRPCSSVRPSWDVDSTRTEAKGSGDPSLSWTWIVRLERSFSDSGSVASGSATAGADTARRTAVSPAVPSLVNTFVQSLGRNRPKAEVKP